MKLKRLNFKGSALLWICGALFCMACQNGGNTTGKAEKGKGTETATEETGVKVAYVEVDSIMTRYNFAIEYADILKKKLETIQSTLNSKGLALQKEAAAFQNNLQSGKYTSQEQAQAEQSRLQNKQQQLQNLQESLGNEYQEEQDRYNNALHDSIQNFLKSYNKQYGYDYILSKSGDNILYANPAHDITDDVIKGLNKRYKSTLKK